MSVMDPNITTLERAFQLAYSGRFQSIKEIMLQLRREGYSSDQIEGPLLVRQLTAAIQSARSRHAVRR